MEVVILVRSDFWLDGIDGIMGGDTSVCIGRVFAWLYCS